MRELTDDIAGTDPRSRPPASPQLRLNTYYMTWLDGAQAAAELLLVAGAGYVFYLIVIDRPGQMLWPAATGRSPQHLLTGALMALLLVAVVRAGHRAIYDDYCRTHHTERLDDYERYQFARNGRALSRTTRLRYLALAALLVCPVVPDLLAAWTANDPAAFSVVGPHLLLRLAPAAALYLLHTCLDRGLDCFAELLENRQDTAIRAALDDAQQQPGFTTAPHPNAPPN